VVIEVVVEGVVLVIVVVVVVVLVSFVALLADVELTEFVVVNAVCIVKLLEVVVGVVVEIFAELVVLMFDAGGKAIFCGMELSTKLHCENFLPASLYLLGTQVHLAGAGTVTSTTQQLGVQNCGQTVAGVVVSGVVVGARVVLLPSVTS